MRLMGALVAVAMLCACGSANAPHDAGAAKGTNDSTAGQAAGTPGADQTTTAQFDAGEWQGTVQITDLDFPDASGLPPELAERFKQVMGGSRPFKSCLTPEQARADPRGFLTKTNGNCTYQHFRMADGTIDAAMMCKKDDREQNVTMKGSYSRASYDIALDSTTDAGEMGKMTAKIKLSAHRTGACAPDDAAQ